MQNLLTGKTISSKWCGMKKIVFSDTLGKGLALLEQEIAQLRRNGQKILAGDVAFRLYDTYGFPLDLTEDFLSSEELSLDVLVSIMQWRNKRTRAREHQKGTVYLSANLTDLAHALSATGLSNGI